MWAGQKKEQGDWPGIKLLEWCRESGLELRRIERKMKMNISLKERTIQKLSKIENSITFKISGSSFIFMKMDVDGLTTMMKQHADAKEASKPLKVRVPEKKATVICLNTGKAQFLNSNEEVHIVELDANEVHREKGLKHDSKDSGPGDGLS